jgi:hypothetical protein
MASFSQRSSGKAGRLAPFDRAGPRAAADAHPPRHTGPRQHRHCRRRRRRTDAHRGNRVWRAGDQSADREPGSLPPCKEGHTHEPQACLFSELVCTTNVVSVTLDGHLRGFVPDIAMMKTAHAGKSDNLGTARGSRLKRPVVRCISQSSMNSITVVDDILAKSPMQMPLVEHNHAVQEFAATPADPSFRSPVLPRASIGGPHGLHAKTANCVPDGLREDRVPVVHTGAGASGNASRS